MADDLLTTLQERFPGIQGDDEPDSATYVLIEKNRKSEPSYWLSAHDTLSAAGEYIMGQEYAEDWEPVVCIHPASETEYEAEVPPTVVTWRAVA